MVNIVRWGDAGGEATQRKSGLANRLTSRASVVIVAFGVGTPVPWAPTRGGFLMRLYAWTRARHIPLGVILAATGLLLLLLLPVALDASAEAGSKPSSRVARVVAIAPGVRPNSSAAFDSSRPLNVGSVISRGLRQPDGKCHFERAPGVAVELPAHGGPSGARILTVINERCERVIVDISQRLAVRNPS